MVDDLFPGFETRRIATSGAEIHLRHGGSGTPLLLLHGYPQTHAIWHRLAPLLAARFHLILPDLRGYGRSSKPPGGPRHEGYAKRSMAQDMAEVMTALGHERFSVIGHDRGGRVAHRLALDHAPRVERLVVLDIVPTLYRFENVSQEVATKAYHWFFLIQPEPFPERLIGADPDFFLRHTLNSWALTPDFWDARAYADYLSAFEQPETIHATCEDYRAGASIDLDHDRADFGRRRLEMPVLRS